ncbi:hypothetical protein [Reyranella sp.]|uniref:hypothetical protein n=1 Tax=Reyranella sp. TaxID=1929291 RepID=UPI00122BC0DF|nr:hypothetical protein [Reyranella sp.]TAJ84523.1 MAG: hypothetical protein EPO50_17680 [Reyranella sp.]
MSIAPNDAVPTTPNTTPSWMMRGKAAHEAYARDAAEQEVRREAQRRLHRFRIDVNEPARITFLDGALDEDGLLAVPSLYEHTVQLAGRWATFVCVGGGAEPCPICDSGRPPALVAAFTVIDHRPYTIRRGPKAGTVVVDQRKLFVAKKSTLAKLQFKATTLGGLDGVTMAVTRLDTGDGLSPGVGTEFDFVERTPLDVLAEKYGAEGVPANYEQEFPYLPASRLIQLGLGRAPVAATFTPRSFDIAKLAEAM